MSDYLKKLNLPDDLKNLSIEELEKVSKEARKVLINAVSESGGHLASSLGVVELTVALHAVLDSPRDKIIWDVGHQAYSHKILTGRLDKITTIRQYGGLSGFTNREESIYDAFGAGHASTSLSAALGFAHARDLKKEKYSIAVVFGDGSLSGGLLFEALNNLEKLKSNLICILNDNDMSISKPVGSISRYITALRTNQTYLSVRKKFERLFSRIPKIGPHLWIALEKLIHRTRNIAMDMKAGAIFEELGLKYIGPVDGHNIPMLLGTLKFAKSTNGPVIVHVITQKGKGYRFAEKDPVAFHGLGPFDVKTGKLIDENESINAKKPQTYSAVFGETLVNLAKKDPSIIVITAAMTEGTGLKDFARKYPDRFFDVGIAEEHAVTFAGGLSAGGLKPIVAIYSTFLQRAYDQILHDVCLQNLPVVFALDRSGIVGEDGATHQGIFDISYLRHIPNLIIMSPKDEEELKCMLETAVTLKNPVAIRFPKGKIRGITKEEKTKLLNVGESEMLYASNFENSYNNKYDVVLFSIGKMAYTAKETAIRLNEKGYTVAVINARFVKPLDEKMLFKISQETDFIVTLEDNVLNGGFGSAVIESLEKMEITGKKIKRIGLPDKFIEHGSQDTLIEKYGLTPKDIENIIFSHIPIKHKMYA